MLLLILYAFVSYFTSLRVKKRAVDILVKDLSHLQCIEHILHVQLHLINFALSYQGNDSQLPPMNLESCEQKSCAQNSANDQVRFYLLYKGHIKIGSKRIYCNW